MKHDIEYYFAYPFRYLAKFAGVEYNGEWRNACAAHVGWGLALTMIAVKISWLLVPIVVLYAVFREMVDSKWFKNWNRKNWVDLFTFYLGELLGILWILVR